MSIYTEEARRQAAAVPVEELEERYQALAAVLPGAVVHPRTAHYFRALHERVLNELAPCVFTGHNWLIRLELAPRLNMCLTCRRWFDYWWWA